MAIVPAVTKNVKSDNVKLNFTPKDILKIRIILLLSITLLLGVVLGGIIQYYDKPPNSIYSYFFRVVMFWSIFSIISSDLDKYIEKWVH